MPAEQYWPSYDSVPLFDSAPRASAWFPSSISFDGVRCSKCEIKTVGQSIEINFCSRHSQLPDE
jgi:hypothetical protein